MQILLVRHGEPSANNNDKLTSGGFANWVRKYNHSLVSDASRPSSALCDKYNHHYIVSSDLPRAIHSAKIALQKTPLETLAVLREMHIPRYKLPFTFNAWTWVYLNRTLWMLGLKGKFESYVDARLRANNAAEKLILLAQQHQNIIVFGHGYMNLHIRKCLSQKGWKTTEKSNAYWGVSCLELH